MYPLQHGRAHCVWVVRRGSDADLLRTRGSGPWVHPGVCRRVCACVSIWLSTGGMAVWSDGGHMGRDSRLAMANEDQQCQGSHDVTSAELTGLLSVSPQRSLFRPPRPLNAAAACPEGHQPQRRRAFLWRRLSVGSVMFNPFRAHGRVFCYA